MESRRLFFSELSLRLQRYFKQIRFGRYLQVDERGKGRFKRVAVTITDDNEAVNTSSLSLLFLQICLCAW